jgi:hypothetical protein
VRRRLTIVALVAALAGCSGDDENDPAAVATAPAQTVTETVERDAPPAKAEKKDTDGKKKQTSETSPKQPAEKGQARAKAPAGQVQATGDSPPEVTLAVIDAESAYVKKSAVARYAGLLDRLEPDCTEARAQLAESALTASHDVQSKTGEKLSILAVLREVAREHPSGQCVVAFRRVAERHGAS